ncbi:unnamed protein product [Spirodela intermedia]|uniref:Uncharacterized protein n=1 Tax=Spirodela intermedia TaxID=51605 RepID=A0A7I8IJP1_SPIIN|nr:unnamed protein product [Spirodela intermedia]CAA6657589.1 unnamed protein product [Spirodela intermedia]
MSIKELKERHGAAEAAVNALKERLRHKRQLLLDTDMAGYSRAQGRAAVSFSSTDLVCCRTLQGHTGKVYSVDWTPEKNRIVSASQDGRLIVWNALTSQKTHAIKLPVHGACSIFDLNAQVDKDGNLPVARTLSGHKGYVSSCQYVPDEETHLITGSGDQTCVLWDITTGQRLSVFGGEFPSGHTADVLSISINSSDPKVFVSGSCDATARLWDMRIASRLFAPTMTMQRILFDLRTGHQLQAYSQEPYDGGDAPLVTSIAFSASGRLLFAAYSNGDCYVWDTLVAQVVLNLGTLQNTHEGRISSLSLSSDGSALCTGSSDKNLKVDLAFGGHRRVI